MSPFEIVMTVVLVTLLGAAVVIYNSLVSLRNDCDRARGNIDVLLKQRTDELPNLLEVCRGYMRHEKETLERVAEARGAALAARTPAESEQAAMLGSRAIGDLFAVVENYPKLKANESFLLLQRRVTGIENEIADRREYFNRAITAWNTRIEQFPDFYIAGMMKARKRPLLHLTGIGPVRFGSEKAA